ncbi:MAG TPA: sugar ABC transporter permease [Clostridium sp.]
MNKKSYTPYVFIAPHLILFIIFFGLPAIFGIVVSFTKWNLVGTPEWVGLKNYAEILSNSSSTFYFQFHNGLKNTLLFTLFSVPFCIIVPLSLAVGLNTKVKGHKIFQSIFYLPTLFSISSVILAWGFLFNKNFGPINKLLGKAIVWGGFGGGGIQPYTWIAIVIITVWWYIGANMVIYQAALAGVPADMYEAASLDGAGPITKFFKISLPSIKDQIAYTLVITTIAQLNVYGQPLMFSKGGPANSTFVMIMYIKQTAFGSGESIAGIASAMSVMLGLCVVFVASLQFYFLRQKA